MKAKVWSTGIALSLLVLALPASATLGEDVTSVRADQARMGAVLKITQADKFAVHEIQLPSGTAVKEYVSPEGQVFAVSWQGPSLPDLQQVLGRYFAQFTEAAQGAASGPRAIQQPGLVVQSAGHMRAFFGRAYLPQMLPQGVVAEDIQ